MRKFFLHVVMLGALAAGIATSAAGCSDDDETPAQAADSGAGDASAVDAATGVGSLTITGTYAGSAQGALIVALFSEQPQPNGPPPIPAATGANETPTWPGTNPISIKNLTPGQYFLGGYIMVGFEHRQQGPQPGDPSTTALTPVTITAGETAQATITLIDLPSDGGAEAGDGGDAGDAADGS